MTISEMSGSARRLIAFYLPQFHPVPENDEWWGKGFTEWTNVAKAKPLFRGHHQPQLPGDLGFYDLRVPEVREAQAKLAREHGIYGFCYYHYWFSGRRLLERPFNDVLASGKPEFPFCLCWANENWTRLWDGRDEEILMTQEYSVEDYRAHLRGILPALHDKRYIRIGEKPIFLVYRASNMPDPRLATETWRDEAARLGLPGIYLCNVESTPLDYGLGPKTGFDASVEFAPGWDGLGPPLRQNLAWRLLRKLGLSSSAYVEHAIMNYDTLKANMLRKPSPDYLRYPCVTPGWDNSARRKSAAVIFRGSTPEKYQDWLERILVRQRSPSAEENFVFINAWNEWAEGNHLEPCARWGHGYLEATRRALARVGIRSQRADLLVEGKSAATVPASLS